VRVMLLVCFVTCIVGLVQAHGGERVSTPFEGEVGEPNTMGGYLVLMISLVLGLMLSNDRPKSKPFLLTLLMVSVVTLALTLSRSSWLAAVPMLATLTYLTKKKFFIIIPLIFIIAVAPIILPQSVKDRFFYTFLQPHDRGDVEIGSFKLDSSTSARVQSWKQVLTKDFVKHPILGHGVTGYGFMDAQYPRVLAETGLLGFVFFFLLLLSILRISLKVFKGTKDPFFRGLTIGYIAGFIGLLTHAVGANTFIIVRIMEPFWFLTAMVVMIPDIERGMAVKRNAQPQQQ